MKEDTEGVYRGPFYDLYGQGFKVLLESSNGRYLLMGKTVRTHPSNGNPPGLKEIRSV